MIATRILMGIQYSDNLRIWYIYWIKQWYKYYIHKEEMLKDDQWSCWIQDGLNKMSLYNKLNCKNTFLRSNLMLFHQLFELIHAQPTISIGVKLRKNCFNLGWVQILRNLTYTLEEENGVLTVLKRPGGETLYTVTISLQFILVSI